MLKAVTTFYDRENTILHRRFYIDEEHKKQGEYKEWYMNGQLNLHCSFKDGLLDGEYKKLYSNGKLSNHYFYKNGKLYGEYESWYENGPLRIHSFYKDNNDITKHVKELVKDITNITDEEKLLIALKFDITFFLNP